MLETQNQQKFRKKLENLCLLYDKQILLSSSIASVTYQNIPTIQADYYSAYNCGNNTFTLHAPLPESNLRMIYVPKKVDEPTDVTFNEILTYPFIRAYWKHLLRSNGVDEKMVYTREIVLTTEIRQSTPNVAFVNFEGLPDFNLSWRTYFAELEVRIKKPLTGALHREYSV